MTVIAITHEIGTLGDELAAVLAEHFGLAYADKQCLEDRIADRWAAANALYYQPHSGVGGFSDFTNISNSRLAKFAADEIFELAAYGDIVLRGWGAATVLRNSDHVLRVRMSASTSFRQRILATSIPNRVGGEICQIIDEADAMLSSNQEPVFGPDWRREEYFDVAMRTDLMSLRQVIEVVERALQSKAHQMRRSRATTNGAHIAMQQEFGEQAQMIKSNPPAQPRKGASTR